MRSRLAFRLLLCTIFIFGLSTPGYSGKKKKAKKEAATPAPKAEVVKPAPKPPKKKGKSFDDVTEGYKRVEGLFSFYVNEDDGKILLEILPTQIDKTYVYSNFILEGDGRLSNAGSMGSTYPFQFKKQGNQIEMIRLNTRWYTSEDDPFKKAIEQGVSDSMIGRTKVLSEPHPERQSILIEPQAFFLDDTPMIEFISSLVMKRTPYKLNRKNSYLRSVQSYPKNSEIKVKLNYSSSKPTPHDTSANSKSISALINVSLYELPEEGYQIRKEDERVGYFSTNRLNYSSLLKSEEEFYINRWRLEKSEPGLPLSKPKKPIVFWIDNTVPKQWRPAIERGILVWNQAFEKVGFKDAVEVRQMPDDADWDAADIRYNVLQWILAPGAAFAAGPSWANPYTGELYAADILFSADYVRFYNNWYARNLADDQKSLIQEISELKTKHSNSSAHLCNYGASVPNHHMLNLMAMTTENPNDPNAVREYLEATLADVVTHEIGHTLGLRHNFKGSTFHTWEEIKQGKLISSSVMDYVKGTILSKKDRGDAPLFMNGIGPYDEWAIEYGYAPYDPESGLSESAFLRKIAEKGQKLGLEYGTDEDRMADGDPYARIYDDTADPIAYNHLVLPRIQELWKSLEDPKKFEGMRYNEVTRVFNTFWGHYAGIVRNTVPYVGGVVHYRDYIGQSDRLPLNALPRKKQQEAMDLLNKAIFSQDAFKISPKLLRMLGPNRHWGFRNSPFGSPHEYPFHAHIATLQRNALNGLLAPNRLTQMIDSQRIATDKGFGIADLMLNLEKEIWKESVQGFQTTSIRRNLQKMHVERLIKMMINPPRNQPADARSLTRMSLKNIAKKMENAIPKTNDITTKAHWDEVHAMITAALKTNLETSLKL